MSSTVALGRRHDLSLVDGLPASERWIRRRVGLAWSLLILNVLTFYSATWSGLPLAFPIPSAVGKMITQGSLAAAMLVAISVNRRLVIRPSVFLFILSLLVVVAFAVILEPGHFGTIYRTFRFTGFVATLWLLTPYWGRRDMLLVRCYLLAISVVLGTVLLGFVVAPRTAYAGGRLEGALWPYPPTQVAHFAAVATGLIILLWLCGLASGRLCLIAVVIGMPMLLLTHTRTALLAMVAGIFVAGLSLFTVKARVRKLFAAGSLVASLGAITLSGVVTTWLARGESSTELTSLTGRTTVWTAILGTPRNLFQTIFGFGMDNLSFNGMAVDSNWLGAYLDFGLLGVALCAAMLLFLFVTAYFQPIGPQRAIALFLVTFCLISSFTETGLSDPSLYLLELTLAASLLVSPHRRRSV
ncbi:MAG TPA: hypothetical protein VN695_16095 [Streptosporangiaceae bacterium]|nr:hypothetical protein [Streptosporangiaceae bacterium]